jgi:hypothetical protein
VATLHRTAALLCAATLLGCNAAEATSGIPKPQFGAADAASGSSASGHANWLNRGGQLVRRSFHARVMKDGTVEGSFVQHNAVTGAVVKGDINCLRLLSPTEAVLSGALRVDTDSMVVGRTAIFRVGDGGEGSDATPDRMSGLLIPAAGSTLDCQTFMNPFFTPIESGNIQVRP